MERLGSGIKSSKLDMKSGRTKSNDIVQSLASSKADDFLAGLHETTGAHVSQTTTKRYLVGNLISYGYREADDLVTSLRNYVEAQAFPSWRALEADLPCKRSKYQSQVFDLGGLPVLPALDMVAGREFSGSAARNHLEKDLLTYTSSEADDHIISSTGYVEAQSFPTWLAPETDFQNKKKYKWRSDNGRISNLPAEYQSALALELHGTGGSGFSVTSAGKRVRNPYRFGEADELVASSMDYVKAQFFPSSYALETDLHCKRRKYPCTSVDREIQYLPVEDKSSPLIEWNTDYGNDYGYHTLTPMISKSNYFIPDNFPSHGHFTEQLLSPLHNPTSIELCDFPNSGLNLQPAEERSPLLLLGWDDNINKELESSVPDDPASKEMSRLPLTLYTASGFHDQAEGCWFINADKRGNTTNSPSRDTAIALRDTFYHKQDGHLSTPRTGYELERKSLPIGSDWDCSELQFHETKVENIYNCLPSMVEFQDQFPGNTSSVTDFTSFGPKFSHSIEGIFATLPNRLHWC